MDKLRELKEFNKWRKKVGKTLPDLAFRVFALRDKGYMGCGFHWYVEKELGYIISVMNDFNNGYREYTSRVTVEVKYKLFIKNLKKIENEISQRTV